MTLQTSGTITASDINAELKRTSGTQFNIGGADERKLAKVSSGIIKLSDFYGKSNGGVGEGTGAAWLMTSYASYGVGGTGTATARIRLLTDGQVTGETSAISSSLMPWYYPLETGIGSEYYVRLSNVKYSTEKAVNQVVTSKSGTPSGNYYSHLYSMSIDPDVWTKMDSTISIYTSVSFSAGSGTVLRETMMTLTGTIQFSADASTVIFSKSFTVDSGTYGE